LKKVIARTMHTSEPRNITQPAVALKRTLFISLKVAKPANQTGIRESIIGPAIPIARNAKNSLWYPRKKYTAPKKT
jgi:hypothetical protein